MSDFFDLSEPETVSEKPQDFPFMRDLNPEQRQAVTTTEGPVLVLSGAGTGKTRVLTTRIAYLLATGQASPWQILAVTFTNKASREMKDRLEQMIGLSARSVNLGTFHAFGVRVLSRYAAEAGLKPDFIVLNTDDQERLLKKIMQENGIDIKQYSPAALLSIIERWKDRGLSPTAITKAEDSPFCDGRAKGFYQLYQDRLRTLNAVDFGDLLLLPLELFRTHPNVLSAYQNKFRYILVDEYQDTNVAQYLLLRLLAHKSQNICCVGDDDQSIYSWRGAEVENILKFQEVYPAATIIRLERNYRSTDHILGAASGLISNNAGRLGKTLKVADTRDGFGDRVHIEGYWNGSEEAKGVIEKVLREQRQGHTLSQMAILVRTSAQTRPFEEQLIKEGIPYKIIGGFKFYKREEIRDAVAYLRLVLNTGDDLAFLRIVNKPRRGIGDGAISALEQAAKEHHLSLFDAIPWAELRPSVRKTLDTFTGLITMMRDKTNTLDPEPLARQLLEDSGYLNMWRTDKSVEAEGRLENIKELYNVLGEFETINAFIEYAALVTDADEKTDGDQLVVMTLHASKGLEFDCVFLAGWEEGLFPHQKTLDESGSQGLEEERRLAYVGLTRAKEKAFISYATNRKIYGQWENALSSRFIDELPDEHVQNDTQINLGGSPFWNKNTFSRYDKSDWVTQESKPFYQPAYTAPKSKRIGKRVYHESFGYGTVIKETPNGLEVHFDDLGLKKVQSRFLAEV
ncbi:MAG: UvrD-helicase domain-containing protein [Alphaproteobacteria bacterium]|nr:UvrD-helicase domain-containing protein [Alphaproteobacteria bacterium]